MVVEEVDPLDDPRVVTEEVVEVDTTVEWEEAEATEEEQGCNPMVEEWEEEKEDMVEEEA